MPAAIDPDLLSFLGQMALMVLATLYGRFATKSRSTIWVASFLGAGGAMLASILVDGQAAFLYLLFAPLIYVIANLGRRDLTS